MTEPNFKLLTSDKRQYKIFHYYFTNKFYDLVEEFFRQLEVKKVDDKAAAKAWKEWLSTNNDLIVEEHKRLLALGYKGDYKLKLKQVFIYFASRNSDTAALEDEYMSAMNCSTHIGVFIDNYIDSLSEFMREPLEEFLKFEDINSDAVRVEADKLIPQLPPDVRVKTMLSKRLARHKISLLFRTKLADVIGRKHVEIIPDEDALTHQFEDLIIDKKENSVGALCHIEDDQSVTAEDAPNLEVELAAIKAELAIAKMENESLKRLINLDLPEGNIVGWSRRFHHVFYYNHSSGLSVWRRPVKATPKANDI